MKHHTAAIAGALALLFLLTGVGGDAAAAPEATSASIGGAVRDGQLEFTVKKVTCGQATVSNSRGGMYARGQFCVARVVVRNLGDEPQLLVGSDQVAYDAAGRRHDANSQAGLIANDSDSGAFVNKIGPGRKLALLLVFDVPTDAELAELELRSHLPGSDGATVTL